MYQKVIQLILTYLMWFLALSKFLTTRSNFLLHHFSSLAALPCALKFISYFWPYIPEHLKLGLFSTWYSIITQSLNLVYPFTCSELQTEFNVPTEHEQHSKTVNIKTWPCPHGAHSLVGKGRTKKARTMHMIRTIMHMIRSLMGK